MNELALFAGVCGGLLATKHILGWRTVCYVEHNRYAVDVIKARIKDGYLDDAPIWDDVFTFNGVAWRGVVDVISAGFPCQPFSLAGKGLAENDPRNGWPATIRIIDEIRPRMAWLENVPGLISKPYIRRIFGDLAEIGYSAEWGCLSAQAVGANHKRERLWILAYADSGAWQLPAIAGQWQEEVLSLRNGISRSLAEPESSGWKAPGSEPDGDYKKKGDDIKGQFIGGGSGDQKNMANPNDSRREKFKFTTQSGCAGLIGRSVDENISDANQIRRHEMEQQNSSGEKGQSQQYQVGECSRSGEWWQVEPELGRVADGVAHRVDRLEAIGNGQVPAVVARAYELLRRRAEG